ncbi:MAG: hypothetical protein GXO09_05475 [Crenarchaeota archaeon]|nr:hypothetical protein [Thermoproteota archaeon]
MKRERRLLVIHYCSDARALLLLILRGYDRVEGVDVCLEPPCTDAPPELGEVKEYITVSPPPDAYTPPWLSSLEEYEGPAPTPCLEELLDSMCTGVASLTGKLEKPRTAPGRREGR